MAEQIAYNMDCMQFMKSLPDKAFDLAVVDPPYGDAGGGGTHLVFGLRKSDRNYKTRMEQIRSEVRQVQDTATPPQSQDKAKSAEQAVHGLKSTGKKS